MRFVEKQIRHAAFQPSINATYTPENVNMIGNEQLDKLKPNAIIVNTARQELINKEDLYNAIIENKVSIQDYGYFLSFTGGTL